MKKDWEQREITETGTEGKQKREMPLFIEGLIPSVMNALGYQQESANRGGKKEG